MMTDYSPNNYLSLTKDEKGDILVEFKQIQEEKKEKDIMDNRLHFYGQGSTPSCVRALRSLFM
ncbi:MAG: hypothetical protein LBU27_00930 [Candidatus Peribacteria bacterium]|nr:hypothetical protein [Candidatus Peribacteria bacterium]